MRMLAGSIFLLAAEQAYAHAFLIPFPHQSSASQVLIPASGVLLVLGLLLTIWGLFPEKRPS